MSDDAFSVDPDRMHRLADRYEAKGKEIRSTTEKVRELLAAGPAAFGGDSGGREMYAAYGRTGGQVKDGLGALAAGAEAAGRNLDTSAGIFDDAGDAALDGARHLGSGLDPLDGGGYRGGRPGRS